MTKATSDSPRPADDLPFSAGFEKEDTAARFRDRTTPASARILSFLFVFGREICILSLVLMTVYLHSLVAGGGETILAPLLTLVAAAPLIGLIIFEFGFAKALSGYRLRRQRLFAQARAAFAIFVFAALLFIHPLLGAGVVLGGLLSFAATFGLRSLLKREPMWDFLPEETASVFAGRDGFGLTLAHQPADGIPLLQAIYTAAMWLSLTVAIASASWLTAEGILNSSAIAAAGLLSFWSASAVNGYLTQFTTADPDKVNTADGVISLPVPESMADAVPESGAVVRSLSVFDAEGKALLSDINFDFEPGGVIGLNGGNFAGKSLLMRTLSDPHHQTGLSIRGFVRMDGVDPWQRFPTDQEINSVYVPPVPLLMPGTGRQNLSCFGSDLMHDRALHQLKRIVLTTDTVEHISSAASVVDLSTTEAKAIAIARAFALRPKIYLLDRPEDGATEQMINSLAGRIQQERRMGACFLLATESRTLLDLCDKLLMMQNGRVIDFGPANEIRQRTSIGWSQFQSQRSLDSEDGLTDWIAAQFRRDGDEANRRKISMIASEMLAFSCVDLPPAEDPGNIRFEYKHEIGFGILRMLDDGKAVSSGFLSKTQQEAEAEKESGRRSPMATVMRASKTFDAYIEKDQRVIEVKIETYDPRKNDSLKASEQKVTEHEVAVQ